MGVVGIYFNNKLLLKPIQNENLFIDNKAEFADDFILSNFDWD